MPEAEGEADDPMEVGGKFKYRLEHLHLDKWLKDLQRDKQQLSLLHTSSEAVTPERDAKLKELEDRLVDTLIGADVGNRTLELLRKTENLPEKISVLMGSPSYQQQ